MKIDGLEKVYMIGIGGIGMSALARYFLQNGVSVSGYDKTRSSLTQSLQDEGIDIFFTEDLSRLTKDIDLVVYTPAIPSEHEELTYLIENDFLVLKRAQVLGQISQQGQCLAVAGSHGKSTTSAMLTHIMHESTETTGFIGAIMTNYDSNYISSGDLNFVVEADEYDRSFLALTPSHAIITAVDSDHLDIYGNIEGVEEGFRQFSDLVKGRLFIQYQQGIIPSIKSSQVITYGLDSEADVYAHNIKKNNGTYVFDVAGELGEYNNFQLSMGGMYNVENALAAIAMALTVGVQPNHIRSSLASFEGLKRRFEKIIESPILYIDDYAHHPSEVSALLEGVRNLYNNRHITAIFQPHLFSRTRDYAQAFAESLDLADDVILIDIYPAREMPIAGVSSDLIAEQSRQCSSPVLAKEQLLDVLKEKDNLDVLLTIGAGDIDTVVGSIKSHFINRPHATT